MKRTILNIFVVAILAAVVLIMAIVVSEEEQAKEEGNTQCEHEFAITSEYNWFFKSYKTYSKCIKCGKEI